MSDIKQIQIDQLYPHPKNPRLVMRQDVIDGIAAQIEQAGQFDPANALLVRPVNGHYQIVEGHHRYRAARQLNLESIPCWVREMTDDEAYMRLALGNVQGELSPLEIGMHALEFVGTSNGGRGVKGGLSEYARMLGKDQAYITRVRQAAGVLNHIKPMTQVISLLDKAQHLAAIHKAPAELWPTLVQRVIDKQMSADQTRRMIESVTAFEIPEKWAFFLPPIRVTEAALDDPRFTPKTVQHLISLAETVDSLINQHEIDPAAYRQSFYNWLILRSFT